MSDVRESRFEVDENSTTEETVADRTPRASLDRDMAETRQQAWRPPQLLPTPEPQEGWVFRWVRSGLDGKSDTPNVSAKFREGWEPVLASEYPELRVVGDLDSRFPENVEIGGLILCKCPAHLMQQRSEYQKQQAQGQMDAVDRNYLRESDPRMPMLSPDRQTRTSRFGRE